ncbi:unnamed protein product [Phytophthora fragariaefolia]|uniref:Unnamed protein product n=1 Tax=Phytophthora fragariaefolia TaxID=1490495 RepID=A0A9W7D0G6_9STRA|nr:unnamed protein product [Phytophthora fragariaefolia]
MRLPTVSSWTGALLALIVAGSRANAQLYDAIVVGSGPGGLVAAEYLSRDSSVSVLILEAGPKSLAATGGTDSPDYARGRGLTKFDIPGEYDSTTYNSANAQYRVDWISDTYLWLGKLVGGCSSINAALYFRPPDSYVTNMQWPFSAAQMVAKMDENEKLHGHTDKPSPNGVWYTQEGYSIVSKALLARGYTERTLNDAAARNSKSKTFGHAPFAFKNGKRDTPAAAFWGPMSTRSNVKLLTGAKVDYILRAAGGKATGVVYNGGTQATLSARGTVIMAAGALSTPKVLIQSGIGPSSQLNMLNGRNGFAGVSQAAGWVVNNNVGRNLFDTNVVFASFSHPQMSSFQYKNKPSWAIDQYMNQGFTGPLASSGPTLISYENYDVQGRTYEFQSTALTTGFGEFYSRNNAFTLSLYVNNPESRTASGFDSNGNWKAYNEGTPFFRTDRDLAAMQSYAQRTVSAMTAQGATFLSAGSDNTSVANWVSANRNYAAQHFGGSCFASKNSADSSRCADEKLRVIGMSNVFVADGSAMRDGTVNPYGFIMYIGREAADQVKSYLASNNAGSTATCSNPESNVNYNGFDIGSQQSASSSSCCSICAANANCKAYTWTNYNGGTCWLKSAKGNTVAQSGAVSATIGGSSSPASSCSTIEENTNYGGADVGNARSSTAEGCCPICKGRTGCNAYTWTNYNSGTCWLKSAKGTATTQSGARSAQISSTSSTCTFVSNVDYANNDVGSSPSATASGCCAICRAKTGCKVFTWTNYNGGTCWLKSAQGTSTASSGAVSGSI